MQRPDPKQVPDVVAPGEEGPIAPPPNEAPKPGESNPERPLPTDAPDPEEATGDNPDAVPAD